MPGLTHETSREGGISANFPIDFDQTLINNPLHLVTIEGILEPVTQEHNERDAFTQLVRAWRGSGGL